MSRKVYPLNVQSTVGNKLGKSEGMMLPDLYNPVWEHVGGLGGPFLSFVLSLFLSFFLSFFLLFVVGIPQIANLKIGVAGFSTSVRLVYFEFLNTTCGF